MRNNTLILLICFLIGGHEVFAKNLSIKYVDRAEKEASSLTDPEEVIANYIKAIGGLEMVSKIKSAYVLMAADFQGMEIETLSMSDSDNARMKQETKVMGQVQQRMILKDGKGLMEVAGQTQDLPQEMLEVVKSQLYVFPEPHYKDLGITMELRGTEKVEGEEAHVLILTMANGMKTVEYYSVSSGLKLKTSSDAAGDMVFADYKEVSGILYPHTMTMTSPMLPVPLETKIQKIEFNKVFSESDFN